MRVIRRRWQEKSGRERSLAFPNQVIGKVCDRLLVKCFWVSIESQSSNIYCVIEILSPKWRLGIHRLVVVMRGPLRVVVRSSEQNALSNLQTFPPNFRLGPFQRHKQFRPIYVSLIKARKLLVG